MTAPTRQRQELSTTEHTILELVSFGMSYRLIARAINYTEVGTRKKASKMFARHGAATIGEMVRIGFEQGYLQPREQGAP